MTFYTGAGCEDCHETGYRGHAIVADVWCLDDEDQVLIGSRSPVKPASSTPEAPLHSMVEDAHDRLASGWTTVDELLRALPASAIAEFKARYS